MYKSFTLHDHDPKFLIPNMKEYDSKKEESQDKNSKDYETIRKLVKDKDKPKKKIK